MSKIAIVPAPSRVVPGEGTFVVTPETTLVAVGPATEVAALFAEQIAPATGFTLSVLDAPQGARPVIAFVLEETAADLGAEGYHLTVLRGAIAATTTAAGDLPL